MMSQMLNFPNAVPDLIGESLLLRELTEADIPAWFERATDAESAWLAGDPIPESIAMGDQWLARHRERFRQQMGLRWAIVADAERPESTQSVGTIGLTITSKEDRIAELGHVIGRAHWNRGIATRAARLVVRYGLDKLGLSEMRAEPLSSNLASIRVLEKVGFRFESVIPDYDQTENGPVEGSLYILRELSGV
jgi:[ribosomal protein S5]-alanine N-acetyltransferase